MPIHNSDLKIAKSKLIENSLTLAIVKKGKLLFETKSPGIDGFLQAIKKHGKRLIASSVADKLVGVAAAALCAYSGMASVFATTISDQAIKVLEDNHILYEFENQVPHILNKARDDFCPLEKLIRNTMNPKEAYNKLKYACT